MSFRLRKKIRRDTEKICEFSSNLLGIVHQPIKKNHMNLLLVKMFEIPPQLLCIFSPCKSVVLLLYVFLDKASEIRLNPMERR